MNKLAPGRFGWIFYMTNFEANLTKLMAEVFLVIFIAPYWWWVNIGSGNSLVPSGNTTLLEPMLNQIYFAIWSQQATMN